MMKPRRDKRKEGNILNLTLPVSAGSEFVSGPGRQVPESAILTTACASLAGSEGSETSPSAL